MGADTDRVQAILGSASSAQNQDELMHRLETPVAGEAFTFRATLLEELLRSCKPKTAMADYDATVDALGPLGRFEELAHSYAGLITVLRPAGRNASVLAHQTLDWLQAQHEANPDGSSVSDMMMDLCASLLIRADLEAAKTNLVRHEETKRKQRNGQATIQAGEDEVNVGGIKVKVRKS